MGRLSKVASIILIMLGGIALVAWGGAGYAVSLYDEGIEDNCDSTVGTIAQITEWDDGQCDDARETKEALENARPIILAIGSLLVGLGLILSCFVGGHIHHSSDHHSIFCIIAAHHHSHDSKMFICKNSVKNFTAKC